MDVSIESVRHIVVNDMSNTLYVDTSRRDICGDKNPIVSLTESVERLQALGLRKITVQRSRIESESVKLLTYLLRGVLHLGEYDHQ